MTPVLPPPPSLCCSRSPTCKGSGSGPGCSRCCPLPAPPLPQSPLQRLSPPAAALGQRPAHARPRAASAPPTPCVRAPAPLPSRAERGPGRWRSRAGRSRAAPPGALGSDCRAWTGEKKRLLFAPTHGALCGLALKMILISTRFRSLSAYCEPNLQEEIRWRPRGITCLSRLCPSTIRL